MKKPGIGRDHCRLEIVFWVELVWLNLFLKGKVINSVSANSGIVCGFCVSSWYFSMLLALYYMLQNISVPKNMPCRINFLYGLNYWAFPPKSSVVRALAIVIKSWIVRANSPFINRIRVEILEIIQSSYFHVKT